MSTAEYRKGSRRDGVEGKKSTQGLRRRYDLLPAFSGVGQFVIIARVYKGCFLGTHTKNPSTTAALRPWWGGCG